MVRLIAYILNAHQDLQFGKGVSDESEAVIWQINYSNEETFYFDIPINDGKETQQLKFSQKFYVD